MVAILVRILSVATAFSLAYYLRQEWLALYLGGPSRFVGYKEFLSIIVPLFLLMFYWRGVFAKSWIRKALDSRIREGVFIHLILLSIASMIAFYQQYHLFSRTFLLLFIFLSFLFYGIYELCISTKSIRARKVLTVGNHGFIEALKRFCRLRGLKFVFLNAEGLLQTSFEASIRSMQRLEPDEILICDLNEFDLQRLKDILHESGLSIQIRDMTGVSMLFSNCSDFKKYENYIMQFLREPNRLECLDRGKRIMDLVLVSLSSPIWLPLILFVSISLKIKQGHVFFRQSRVGQFGRVFSILKFCSMKPVRSDQSFAKSEGIKDNRLTEYGWFLRRTSIDELPQLWNVMKGDMSLVGPRPELLEIVAKTYEPKHWKRSLIKPGLTGLWQICGRKQPIHDHLKYDFFYLKNRGILFDLFIIVRTIPVIFKRKTAM